MHERESGSRVDSSNVVEPYPADFRQRSRRGSSRLLIPTPQKLVKPAGTQPPAIEVSPPGAANSGEQPLETVAENQHQADNQTDMLRAIPSWLVSMVVHVTILLVLALCTLQVKEYHDAPIVMELSETTVEMSTSLMEISLDEPTLTDSPELLAAPTSDFLEFENVMLEPEIDDASALLRSTEELPPIDLEEFHTAAEKRARLEKTTGDDRIETVGVFEQPNGIKRGEQASAEFFGTRSYGSKFVFVIDGSSSMMQGRWLRAQRELISTINELDDGQEFLVLVYNTSTAVMFNERVEDAVLIPASAKNKHRIKIWLGNRRPRGGTLPARTMQLALAIKPDAIYFLSDGELGDDTIFRLATWNAPKEDDRGQMRQVPIHTVLLGSRFGALTMKAIADQNNGIFTAIQ